MKPETQSLVALTEKSYDEYNAILPVIKSRLGFDRTAIFETILAEELPLTTARRAFRTAIMVAMDEPKVVREAVLEAEKKKKFSKKSKK